MKKKINLKYTVPMVCLILSLTACGGQKDGVEPTPISENEQEKGEELEIRPGGEDGNADANGVSFDVDTNTLWWDGFVFGITGDDTVSLLELQEDDRDKLILADKISYNGKDYTVTEISNEAFMYKEALTQVTVPATVKKIGDSAFAYCENLKQVILSEGVREIGSECFNSCTAMEKITFPDSLDSLGESVFFDCERLSDVTFPKALDVFPRGLFTNCVSLESVNFPEKLVVIEEECFWGCEGLSEVVIPDSVSVIGDRAFYSSGITGISFPDKKISLGDSLFDGCDKLVKVVAFSERIEYYQEYMNPYLIDVETVE